MNLAIDIGNTFIKAGWFDGEKLISKHENISLDELKQLINARKPPFVIGSSTASEIFDEMPDESSDFILVSSKLKFPFHLKYKTPETLGADRLAAVAGAGNLFPGERLLVIDAGTCITYEYLDENKNYFGGSISPGVRMRFRAMHQFTARLPQLDIPENFPEIVGDTTSSCMESGVLNGIFFEMENFIQAYTAAQGKISVVLTGGDANYFEKKFKGSIFAAPDLVLIGLNVILQYNAANS